MINPNLARQHNELYKLLAQMKSLGYNIKYN